MHDPLLPDPAQLDRLTARAAALIRDQLSGSGAAAALTSLDEALAAVDGPLPVEPGEPDQDSAASSFRRCLVAGVTIATKYASRSFR